MLTLSRRIGVCSCVVLGLAALVTLPGCGKATGEVKGKVTYKGNLLKGGTVLFVGAAGEPSSSAGIDENGNYTIPKLYAGEYKVCVETVSLLPGGKTDSGKNSSMPPGMAAKMPGGGGANQTIAPPKGAFSKVKAGNDGRAPGGEYKSMNPADNAAKYVSIPTTYGKAESTTLTFTYDGGSVTHNIDLK